MKTNTQHSETNCTNDLKSGNIPTKIKLEEVLRLEKIPTLRTPEKEESLALIQIIVPIIVSYYLNSIYQDWKVSTLLTAFVLIALVFVYPTFRAMKNLKNHQKIILPVLSQWKYLAQCLELDENNNIVRCKIVYVCPTCKGILSQTSSFLEYRYTCNSDKEHNFIID